MVRGMVRVRDLRHERAPVLLYRLLSRALQREEIFNARHLVIVGQSVGKEERVRA
jgi:hypothetical protein